MYESLACCNICSTRASVPLSTLVVRVAEIWIAGSSPKTFGNDYMTPSTTAAAITRYFHSG